MDVMRRHATAGTVLLLLAGCAAPGALPPPAIPDALGPVPVFGGGEGRLEPLRDGAFVLVSAEGTVPVRGLQGLEGARIVATLRLGEEGLALLAGSQPNCPVRHVVVAVRAQAVRSFPLPDCARAYALAAASDGTSVAVHETGSMLPVVFLYRDGNLLGPVVARPRTP